MDRIKNHILFKKCEGKTVIAHAGHRDLLAGDIPKISNLVRKKLQAIAQGKPEEFVLLTGIAEGADKLVADAAIAAGIKVVLLVIDNDLFPGCGQGDHERIQQLSARTENSRVDTLILQPDIEFPHMTPYELLVETLVRPSVHLLALWDGVDTGKAGGTWQAVNRFKEIKGKHGIGQKGAVVTVHHLLTRREKNTIPSAQAYLKHIILPRKPYDWEVTEIKVAKTKAKSNSQDYSDFIYRFGIPFILALCVFVTGWIGYLADKDGINLYGNAFFFAANLITLNESVFQNPVSFWTKAARIVGTGLAAYGFGLALYFALGKENFYRIKFWVYRKLGFKFSVVIGLNEIAYDILKDLRSHKSKVVVLSPDVNSPYRGLARNEGAWVIAGLPTDSVSLQKTCFQYAEQIFVVTGSEEENVRCVLEMDQMVSRNKRENSSGDWFVHIQNKKLKQLLQQSISAKTHYALTVFSHAENAARRMMAGFPEVRTERKGSLDIIIGFGDLGQALALKSIQRNIYTENRTPQVVVFFPEEDALKVERFKKEYGYLFPYSIISEPGKFQETADWTFFKQMGGNKPKDRINFYPLPGIPQQIIYPRSILLSNIVAHRQAKVFACLASGLESAAFLTAVLPGLEHIKLEHPDFDLQVYCFYNFPDEEEEIYLEHKLNALAPHIPVKSFGNYLFEFSCEAIQNKAADHLAKQIALWYYLLYDYGTGASNDRNAVGVDVLFDAILDEDKELRELYADAVGKPVYGEQRDLKIETFKRFWYHSLHRPKIRDTMVSMMQHCWKSLSETDREGNRQAADHLWVKVTEFDKSWELSDKAPDIQDFQNFWTAKEIRDLSEAEHRRWNTMKILYGWRPFEGDDWKLYKENYKAQKLHSLLLPFKELPSHEVDKDYHQIEGIPYFIAFLYKAYYGVDIAFKNLKPNL